LSDSGARGRWQPRSTEQRLRDIIHYGTSILETLRGLSYADFRRDTVRQKAIAYDFQCVSEATARVLDLDSSISDRHPNIPWASARALGNVTRHEYGRLDVDILWTTATSRDLLDLIEAARHELERF
jgi:uncharacterized protein with HEPN domain